MPPGANLLGMPRPLGGPAAPGGGRIDRPTPTPAMPTPAAMPGGFGQPPAPGSTGAPRPGLSRPGMPKPGPGGSLLAPGPGAVPPDAELCRRSFPPDTGPLGMQFDTTVPLTVRLVLPDSEAKCRDVRPGDVLLRVNDVNVAAMRREQVKPLLQQRPLFLDFARPRRD